jgi:dethiobiotin synthetase
MTAIGITGTDTGVGKTTIGCAILALLAERGLSTAAMKPVETGIAEDAQGDAARLMRFATSAHPIELVRPYRFDAPLAPMAAAELGSHRIELEVLDRAFETLRRDADAIVIEGAGGALVPVTETISIADIFRRWSLEAIIVAANRLGVLNHALLTECALREVGCSVRGIVLVDQARADESSASNGQVLSRIASVPVFRFPRLPDDNDPQALASAARHAGLDALLDRLTTSTAFTR